MSRWGRRRKKNLKKVTVGWRRALTAFVREPWHGYREGGFLGAAVGGAAGFVQLLAQPVLTVQGVFFYDRNLFPLTFPK